MRNTRQTNMETPKHSRRFFFNRGEILRVSNIVDAMCSEDGTHKYTTDNGSSVVVFERNLLYFEIIPE